jgi:hypothetical protein
MYKMDLADLKLEGSKAYNEKDYSTAVKLYSVVCCMTLLYRSILGTLWWLAPF